MHNEASLKSLTVPKLKELLSKASLTQSGKKDELIARLLENPASLIIEDEPATATTSEEVNVIDASIVSEPIVPVAATSVTEATSVVVPVVAVKEVIPEPVLTPEEKLLKATLEEEKRKKRIERFGLATVAVVGEVPEVVVDAGEVAKNKRAERFGTGKEEKVVVEGGESQFEKSLAALDKPLGEKKLRTPKTPAVVPAATSAPKVTVVAPVVPVVVDPLLASKMAEEEEKKKKRAARFGSTVEEPAEKKAKVDA